MSGGNSKKSAPRVRQSPERDYEVGYKRPPKQHQFKPGQSGNPNGRPKGSVNAKSIIDRVAWEMVTVQQGEKKRTMPMLQVVVHAQAAKAAKGDSRAANFLLGAVREVGLLANSEEDIDDANALMLISSDTLRPGVALLRGVQRDNLSRDELKELSHLADKIDLGGDVTALSEADFARLKLIIEKGRGKDITRLQ
jgi:hypothetical protein